MGWLKSKSWLEIWHLPMGTRAGTEVNEYTDVSWILDTDPYLMLFWCLKLNSCALVTACPLQSYFSSGWHSFDPGMEISPTVCKCLHFAFIVLFSRLLGSRSIPTPVHTSISCLACPSFSGQGLLQAPTAPGTDLCHNVSAWVEMLLFPSA